ncbi:class I tRNA ligase family protein [bacterium]|nr:class I tRNA ligase family protein [bacterium]
MQKAAELWGTDSDAGSARPGELGSPQRQSDVNQAAEGLPEAVGSVDLAEKMVAVFRRDCRRLKIKDYAAYTRATDFVQGQIDLAAKLIELGHAYVVDGEVFYSVDSFPGYGKLSGRTIEEQEVGASGRVTEDVSRKRNPADFTLWKPSEGKQPRWETGYPDWPQGRPGWHLECSVMSTTMLGSHFDVHGGGVDNMFPHHENEIAQSEPVCGAPWVRYWLHPEHLDLRGVKMSKSLGNVISPGDLVNDYGDQAVRWFFSTTHYRSKLPFSPDLIASSLAGFEKISRLLKILEGKLSSAPDIEQGVPVAGLYASQRDETQSVPRLRHYYNYGHFGELSTKFMQRFREALDDDLNTPQAAAAFFDYVGELYSAGIESVPVGASLDSPSGDAGEGGSRPATTYSSTASLLSVYRCLTRHLYVLGVEYPNELLYPQLAMDCFPAGGAEGESALAPHKAFIDALLEARQQARRDKDFAKSDMIRDLLAGAGLQVEDTPQGPRWSL